MRSIKVISAVEEGTPKRETAGKRESVRPAKKLRACGYARVSTCQDNQDGSFDTQCRYLEARIQGDPSLEYAGVYGDRGKSGRYLEGRPELKRLLADAESGTIDLVLCKSISRLARNAKEFLEIIRRLRRRGVVVRFEREGLDTGTLQGEIVLTILGAIAAGESESICENMRASRTKALSAGVVWGKPRYGYVMDEKKRWVICEQEAAHVRRLFALAAQCADYPTIVRRMNQLEESENTGKIWKHNMVVSTLRSEVYVGDYISNKFCHVVELDGRRRKIPNKGIADQIYIQEHHPAIIDRALFQVVGELMDRKLLHARRRKLTLEDQWLAARAASCAAALMEGEDVSIQKA